MTSRQITTRLKKNNIEITELEISKDEIEVACGYTEHFNGNRNIGECDETAVKAMVKKIKAIFPEIKKSYTGRFLKEVL